MSLVMLILSGCTSHALYELKGESNHWKTEFIVTKRMETDNGSSITKYVMETKISSKDPKMVVYDASYEIDMAGLHQSSGKMSDPNGKKGASFFPMSEMYDELQSGDEITVKIKWNKNNEEEIVMKVN